MIAFALDENTTGNPQRGSAPIRTYESGRHSHAKAIGRASASEDVMGL
jgi:hypothetical protein